MKLEDRVIRLDGTYAKGRTGTVIEVGRDGTINEGRVRVAWDGHPRTWVKITSVKVTETAVYRQKITLLKVEDVTSKPARITQSADSRDFLAAIWDADSAPLIENFYAVYLDRKNSPICWALISQGGMAGTVVDVKIVFSYALLAGAHALIVAHNHPSGVLEPSRADITVTKKIADAARVLDMQLLDHLIMGPCLNEYYSFGDEFKL